MEKTNERSKHNLKAAKYPWFRALLLSLTQQYQKKTGKTIKDVAFAIDVDRGTFSRWLAGRQLPPVDKLARITRLFTVPDYGMFFMAISRDLDRADEPSGVAIQNVNAQRLLREAEAMLDGTNADPMAAYNKASESLKYSTEKSDVYMAHILMARAFIDLGYELQARPLLETAFMHAANSADEARCFSNLAICDVELGLYNMALVHAQAVLDTPDIRPKTRAFALYIPGRVEVKKFCLGLHVDKNHAALEKMRESVDIFRQQNINAAMEVSAFLAVLEHVNGHKEVAKKMLDDVLDFGIDHAYWQAEGWARWGLALIEPAMPEAAVKAYQIAEEHGKMDLLLEAALLEIKIKEHAENTSRRRYYNDETWEEASACLRKYQHLSLKPAGLAIQEIKQRMLNSGKK